MPCAFIVCGPSGVGKSTIGVALARALGCQFEEGDRYHSEANVKKMAAKIPLDDADRAPWLQQLRDEVISRYLRSRGESVVLACSALKRSYRNCLRAGGDKGCVHFLLLTGDATLISERMKSRSGHFMPPSLLASQLATLEPLDQADEDGIVIDVTNPPEAVLAEAVHYAHGAVEKSEGTPRRLASKL